MEFNTNKPEVTSMYLVNRGKQGNYYRHYNAETDTWSLTGASFQEAVDNIGVPSPIGFFPWAGPLTGPLFKENVEIVNETEVKEKSKRVKVAKVKTAKVKVALSTGTKVKTPKTAKAKLADGTIFFREDRQKFVVIVDGKQPCARPTADGCIKWLAKAFPSIAPIITE